MERKFAVRYCLPELEIAINYNFMDVTKDFRGFADMVDMNYHEVYDFNQAASGNEDSQATFRVVPANGAPDDTLIIYNAHHDVTVLRLSPAAKAQGFIYTRIGER